MKRTNRVHLVLVVLVAMFVMPAAAYAATCPADELPTAMSFTKESRSFDYKMALGKGVTVKNLKCSKKGIVKAKVVTLGGEKYLSITPKKAGKTTVSFTYAYQGATKTKKIATTVRKYVKPFTSIKIGSTNLGPQFAKGTQYLTKTTISGKLKIACAKGWKVSIHYMDAKGGWKSVKNGSSVKLKKDTSLHMIFTKGSLEEDLMIYHLPY